MINVTVFLLILWILDYLFSSMIKQVPNSLTVHDDSWTLKFDNFPEFQNAISDSSQRAPLWTLRTKIDVTQALVRVR